MTAEQVLLTLLVVSAPVTLALIVAFVRGYTIDVHLTREDRRPRWTRRDDPDP